MRLSQRAAAVLAALALGCWAGGSIASPRWSHLTEISFQHLTQDSGLPNEIATAIAEDGDGFLWVGTLGGLARWDGYRFRVYRSDPRTAGALPDNVVQTLHGDAAGRLWVGTSAAGLVRYERSSDRFVSYPAGPNGLSHVSVRAIVDDGAGGLWVATDGGLDHVDPASGAVRHLLGRSAPGDAAGLVGDSVQVLLRDRQGGLWAGTPAGLFRRDAGAKSFVRVMLAAGSGADRQPAPQSLVEDSGGRIWVGTLRHGAYVIEADRSPARPVRETSPAAGATLLDEQIVGIVEARPGEIWLGTLGQGIVSVDVATRETSRIRNVPTLPVSLPNNAIRDLHRDRSGLVWVATNRGLSRHDPRQSAILTMFGAPARDPALAGTDAASPSSADVSWILPRPDGRIWLGTHKGGIDIVDPADARVVSLRPDAARLETALPRDAVLALESAVDGSVFIGTKRGLYHASADGARVERVQVPGRDPGASTWSLLADGPANTLWIGGQYDGLWKLDLATGAAAPVLREAANRLSDQRIIVLARGAAGVLWVGTRYGLNRYDTAAGTVTQIVPAPTQVGGLSAGFITALFTDRQQRLWVGTYGGGLNILDASTGTVSARFRHLSTAQGLPDDNVNALLEDPAGKVWASTDNGLAMIDPTSLAVRSMRRAEGVVFPTYWTGSAARTAEGELLFGGSGGTTIVRPARLESWRYDPAVVVSDIRVGGKSVAAGRLAGAGAGADTKTELTIAADANSLAVEFSAIDYSAPERNRYAYRLEGFDPDWIETDATRRLAAYTNLPPGNYRLRLRGSNRDGAWSTRELALPLRVLPAWHQTLWFRSVAALAGLLALFAVVQLRTRFLRAQHSRLERKVRERTAELEKVSSALKEKSRVLELSSISDPLTGLRNRRFLAQHIETEIAASQRRALDARPTAPRQPVDTDTVFLLIDVDHFKRVNDGHGHAAGDSVLVQFGRRLQSVLRESDYLVRWGGEEFLAVARDTDRARADELAERLRAVVAEMPFTIEGGRTLAISCSIGFACVPFVENQPRALGWQDVMKLADFALFTAKRAGRNAWVGLCANEAADAEGLLQRIQAEPQQTVRSGEIRLASNKAHSTVFDALQAHEAPAVAAAPAG